MTTPKLIPMQITAQFLTVSQVAQIFNVGKTTVYYWTNPKNPRHKPQFPKSYKLGRGISRWKAAEIQAYIDTIQTP